ncbi:hypothetical protein F5Y01DRAFT_240561 [Xylaria sp. FL0043]|nr:hypothetical protein F5Y01DRAFT_240561 [Xylaria sp. FL0043]
MVRAGANEAPCSDSTCFIQSPSLATECTLATCWDFHRTTNRYPLWRAPLLLFSFPALFVGSGRTAQEVALSKIMAPKVSVDGFGSADGRVRQLLHDAMLHERDVTIYEIYDSCISSYQLVLAGNERSIGESAVRNRDRLPTRWIVAWSAFNRLPYHTYTEVTDQHTHPATELASCRMTFRCEILSFDAKGHIYACSSCAHAT